MRRPARERANIHLRLPAEPGSVSTAQHSVFPVASGLPPAVVDDVRLLISELVTNAIRHGGLSREDWIELEVEVSPATVHVEVVDPGVGFRPQAPSPRTPDSPGSSGWGLVFLDRIASRWGVNNRNGTCVWFEMDLGRAGA
jgi:anti-sigma regulatory factor (Ser/Thr protein kinase)